jgi:hypothetical protein
MKTTVAIVSAIAAILLMVLCSSGVASATPGNGTTALTLSVSCDGQPLTFIVEGSRGVFATAYVVETGQLFVPTLFTFNGTVTASHPSPVPANEVTCTATIGGGTFSVTGYFVPPTA